MVNKKMIGGAIALVSLAAIVLMGLAVVEGFSKQLRDPATVVNATLTMGGINDSTLVGTTGQYPYLQTMTLCTNASNETGFPDLGTGNFSIAEGTADGGFITLNNNAVGWGAESVNCTLTYLADSTLSDSADNFSTGLGIFGSFIGVLVLAILGMFILNLFTNKKED